MIIIYFLLFFYVLARISKCKRTKGLVGARLKKFCWMRNKILDIWAGLMQVMRFAVKCSKVRGRKRKCHLIWK